MKKKIWFLYKTFKIKPFDVLLPIYVVVSGRSLSTETTTSIDKKTLNGLRFRNHSVFLLILPGLPGLLKSSQIFHALGHCRSSQVLPDLFSLVFLIQSFHFSLSNVVFPVQSFQISLSSFVFPVYLSSLVLVQPFNIEKQPQPPSFNKSIVCPD